MNDDDVIARVRSAVEAQVSSVGATPPELVPRYDTPVTEIRPRRALRWALPAGLAAAAVVVLGAVLVTRGDDTRDLDVAATTTAPTVSPAPLERWVLDLDETPLTGAEEATTSSVAIGTTVYYTDGRMAAVRTNGTSALLARSSWTSMDTVTLQGVQATWYRDGDQELLVAPTEPPLTIETTGSWDALLLGMEARLVNGVWEIDATEIGRRSPEDLGMRYSSLQYEDPVYVYDRHQIFLSVVDHPAGARGFLLDAGISPTTTRTVNGMTFVQTDPVSWVLLRDRGPAVGILDSSPDGPSDEVLGSLKQVSDAEWRALVAPIRPDLATPGTWSMYPPTSVPLPVTRYRAIGTVLEVPGKSLELCLGGVDESLPPQCDGVTVSPPEWRWPEGTFETSADGTRWAEYYVEGTYDGTTFTSTMDPRVPTPDDRALFPQTAIDFTTPCPAPAEGWLAVAANAPTGEAGRVALEQLTSAAAAERDFVGYWVDRTIRPDAGSAQTLPDFGEDPTKEVINLAFTGDIERHRAELSKLWTGALCISQTPGKSDAELHSIQDSLPSMSPDYLSSEIDVTRGVILARFVVVPQYLQDGLDNKYGTGTIIATGALVPLT